MASTEIELARRKRRMAIVTGGTGLYLRALTMGLADIPDIPPAIRHEARARLTAVGAAGIHAELTKSDPIMAARLHASDGQRLARAWEVMEATGQSLADWQDAPDKAPPEDWSFFSIRLMPPREAVYFACDNRFDNMMARGALEEARALAALNLDPDLPAMKAGGVPPLIRCINGEISLEAACRLARRDTRRFARRQIAWFRNQLVPTLSLDTQYSKSLNSEIFSLISEFLLTTNR